MMTKMFPLLALSLSAVAAQPEFECSITTDRATYQVGEKPKFTCSITNKSKRDVVLPGSLDGSEMGRRFPHCGVQILDAAGKLVAVKIFGCGNMSVLRPNDFVTVPSGGTFNPFGPGFYDIWTFHLAGIQTPGKYTFRFTYATSDRIEDYFGDERMTGQTTVAPEIERLFKQVPKLDLKSKDLELTFTAAAK